MIRSSLGISKIPVNPEIDPGFGPDTEQRRVDFAAKLEKEAFSIALGDATKLAKANMITALKLWEREDLIILLEKLDLRDIMIIWLVFEVSYIVKIWKVLDKNIINTIKTKKSKFRKLIDSIFYALSEDIPHKFNKMNINKCEILKIRKIYGGDLIFSLKYKNDNEIIKMYEMTYSKLPKSLRDEFYNIITGLDIKLKEIANILIGNKKSKLKEIIKLINEKIKDEKIYEKREKELRSLNKLITAFDERAEKHLKGEIPEDKRYKFEVNKRVKSYYGIK
ncbi:hypothetical protein ACFLY9_01040 [Patescibacteria group bacterium]